MSALVGLVLGMAMGIVLRLLMEKAPTFRKGPLSWWRGLRSNKVRDDHPERDQEGGVDR
jgi:hypothetical protein